MAITKLDLAHAEGDFIGQIADLKKRLSALERQAIKVDENDFTLPVGGISVRNGLLTLGAPGSVEIVSGEITINKSHMQVDTEGAAGPDQLDSILGGVSGALLVIRQLDDARNVTCADGAGNMRLAGNYGMTDTDDTLTLIYDAETGYWLELSRSNNS